MSLLPEEIIQTEGKFISLASPRRSTSGKTMIWDVVNDFGAKIGEIRWFGRWRCYSFYPLDGTIFEHQCLMDLSRLCQNATTAKRKRRA